MEDTCNDVIYEDLSSPGKYNLILLSNTRALRFTCLNYTFISFVCYHVFLTAGATLDGGTLRKIFATPLPQPVLMYNITAHKVKYTWKLLTSNRIESKRNVRMIHDNLQHCLHIGMKSVFCKSVWKAKVAFIRK